MNRREFLGTAATVPFALAFAPGAFAARVQRPVALVTADLESHVVVLDLPSARPIARIGTAPDPRSVEAVGPHAAVVAHTEIGAVSILDTTGGVRVRAELDGFAEPRYTAVHPSGRFVYVTDSGAEVVVVVDVERGRVVGRTSVPGPARHVSMRPDGRSLWTALGTAATQVAALDLDDPRRPSLRRTFACPFLAHDVVFAPDGRTAWVTSGDARRVALYRGSRLHRVLSAGRPPQHVAFAGDRVFLASGDDGTVRRYRADGKLLLEARVPLGSYNVTFRAGHVVTPSLAQGRVSVLGPNGRLRATTRVAHAAHDACIVLGR